MTNCLIRQEQPEDFQRVFEITGMAFRTMPFADGDEQFLVGALRKNKSFIPELSLVAEVDNKVVGHMAKEFIPGALDNVKGKIRFLPEFGVE